MEKLKPIGKAEGKPLTKKDAIYFSLLIIGAFFFEFLDPGSCGIVLLFGVLIWGVIRAFIYSLGYPEKYKYVEGKPIKKNSKSKIMFK